LTSEHQQETLSEITEKYSISNSAWLLPCRILFNDWLSMLKLSSGGFVSYSLDNITQARAAHNVLKRSEYRDWAIQSDFSSRRISGSAENIT